MEELPNFEELKKAAKTIGSGAMDDSVFEGGEAKETQGEGAANLETVEVEHAGHQKNDVKNAEKHEVEAIERVVEDNKGNAEKEKELTPEQKLVTELQVEVDLARKEYLEEDYKKKKAYKQVLEYFKKNNPNEGKHYEQDQDLAYYRANYDDKLMKLRDAKVAEAKARGASDQEIADIFESFLFEQNLKMREVHDDVKAENQEGKVFGFIKDQALEISRGYRSLSFKQKLAIGAAFAGATFGLTTAGAAVAGSASVAAGILAGRKILMGMITGVGTAEGLVAKTVKNEKNEIENKKTEFLEKLAMMNEEEKYKFLSQNTWDIAIKDEKRAIDVIKNKNLGSLAAGTAMGVFVGSGLMGQLMGKLGHGAVDLVKDTWVGNLTSGAYHKVADLFPGHHEAVSVKVKAPLQGQTSTGNAPRGYETYGHDKSEFKIPEADKSASVGVTSNAHPSALEDKFTAVTPNGAHPYIPEDKFANVTPSGAMSPEQQVTHLKEVAKSAAEKLHPTSLEVKGEMVHGHFKSDSIWKETKGLVEKLHPGVSKAEINEYTRNILDNSVKHYAQEHHISAAEAMTKLSKIHGAKLDITYDPNGVPNMHIHDVKFMHEHATHHVAHHAPIHHEPLANEPNTDNYGHDYQTEINADQAQIAAEQEKYNIAASIANGETPVLDPNSPNFTANVEYSNMLSEGAKRFSWGPSYEVGRIGEIVKHAQEHMHSLMQMNDREAFNSIRKTFFDSDTSKFHKFEKVKVLDALKDPSKLKGLSNKAFEKIVGYANSDLTKPKVDEDFQHWTFRIMKLSRNAMNNDLKMAA